MTRRRDYAAEYAARQARARAAGFESYYGRRIRAGAPPSEPRPLGEALRLARGHAGPADLERALRSGRVTILQQTPVGERDEKGRYQEVRVTAQFTDGHQRSYRLRSKQLEADNLRPLRQAAVDVGVDIYTNPSLDVLGFRAHDLDLEEVEEDWLDLEEETEAE